jgi:hypothetical protein
MLRSMSMWALVASSVLMVRSHASADRATGVHGGSMRPLVARGGDQNVEVVLRLPAEAHGYSRDALIPATVTLTNRTASYVKYAGRCSWPNPSVRVYGIDGHLQFPLALPYLAPPSCEGSDISAVLAPHRKISSAVVFIARGRVVRSVFEYAMAGQTVRTARTQSLLLSLHPGAAPAITTERSPSLRLIVARPRGADAPLRYVEEARCPATAVSGPTYVQSQVNWSVARGNRLSPPCPSPVEWRVVAGWDDAPVVRYVYRR